MILIGFHFETVYSMYGCFSISIWQREPIGWEEIYFSSLFFAQKVLTFIFYCDIITHIKLKDTVMKETFLALAISVLMVGCGVGDAKLVQHMADECIDTENKSMLSFSYNQRETMLIAINDYVETSTPETFDCGEMKVIVTTSLLQGTK